ncbi:MAG TPA: NAD(P)-binding protein [Acidisarcina sp.]
MEKIAILGGGIAALTAAYELTSVPGWQQRYQVDVYTLGWRLGGKGACGRNRAYRDRIEEHGIHLWMGFYENSFNVLRHVYDECGQKGLMPDTPFTDVTRAFTPMVHGVQAELVGSQWKLWDVPWPSSNDFPGSDELFDGTHAPPTPWDFSKRLMEEVRIKFEETAQKRPLLQAVYQAFAGELADSVGDDPAAAVAASTVHSTWLHAALTFAQRMDADAVCHSLDERQVMVTLLQKFLNVLRALTEDVLAQDDDLRHAVILIDTFVSMVIGMHADDVLCKGFLSIDDLDFSEWLARHGCSYPSSAVVKGLYDGVFAYENGDRATPRIAAGTGLYTLLRLALTYRGAVMYWMNAGMGETIFSPIYLVLAARGVTFHFFHKVSELGVSPDGQEVDTIAIDVQATVKPELGAVYSPLFTVSGIPCWPTEPFFDQLVEGDAIQKCTNPNLESWWTDWEPVASRTLKKGVDFDSVVLATSLGTLPYLCKQLIERDKTLGWKNMVTYLQAIKTQGLQLWLNKTAGQQGWTRPRGILCGYVEPFDTWSDMTPLLPRESWLPEDNAQQSAYFCNAYLDPLPTAPFSDPAYPARERQCVIDNSLAFLSQDIGLLLPGADNNGVFDFGSLVSIGNAQGQARLLEQFFRVNIDPSELYVLSLPGTTKYRLAPSDSRFSNLYLAGDWTLSDLNVGCIEATVISGKLAARAISGSPGFIYGSFGSPVAHP